MESIKAFWFSWVLWVVCFYIVVIMDLESKYTLFFAGISAAFIVCTTWKYHKILQNHKGVTDEPDKQA